MFWAYLDGLFENQDDLGPEMYEALAAELELDGTAVREDATEQAYDETVSHDTSEAEDAGVDGTPTVVIDGSVVEWGDEIAFEPVAEAIDEALQ
jgi:protein-disulfide isomerase